METSPTHMTYETSDYGGGLDFDPRVDFSQFLEEAKRDKVRREVNVQSWSKEETGKTRMPQGDKKKKSDRSWKKSLLKWWKLGQKKNKGHSDVESPYSSNFTKPRKGNVISGPIYGSGTAVDVQRRKGSSSGPLSSLCHSNKGEGNETPYICLNHLNNNNPNDVNAYGPVYLVT